MTNSAAGVYALSEPASSSTSAAAEPSGDGATFFVDDAPVAPETAAAEQPDDGLDAFQREVAVLRSDHLAPWQTRAREIEERFSAGELAASEMLQTKNELRQINGLVERFQEQRVDGLETSHIISRRDEARAQRRALNADVEALRTLVQRLHDRISADLDRLPEDERSSAIREIQEVQEVQEVQEAEEQPTKAQRQQPSAGCDIDPAAHDELSQSLMHSAESPGEKHRCACSVS